MGWIIKMLLKLFKPFAKMMILEALFNYFTEAAGEEEPTDGTTEPATEEETTLG